MGFRSVMENVSTYLDAGIEANAITGLAAVFDYPPKITNEGKFVVATEDPGHQMGTICYLYLQRLGRARVGVGGPHSGIKKVRYELTFIGFTRSSARKAQDCAISNHACIDSLTAYIEANRIANSGLSAQPIFSWGEGESLGADDFQTEITLPRLLRQGISQVFFTMRVTVLEYVYT